MSINPSISKLAERVRNFLSVNDKVELMSLKLHLDCKETELLLAIGILINTGEVDLERDSWKLIIQKKS